jgi:hypothetical protein
MSIENGADPTLKTSIENYYKWSIIATTAFAPSTPSKPHIT